MQQITGHKNSTIEFIFHLGLLKRAAKMSKVNSDKSAVIVNYLNRRRAISKGTSKLPAVPDHSYIVTA